LRILVPLDGSELAGAVVGPAAELADALQAGLLLLRVVEPRTFEPFSAEPELAKASDELEKVAERLRTPTRSVRVRAVGGFALPTIQSVIREEQVDLIAMATHGRTGLARLTLGSVAAGTLKNSRHPIMLIRPAGAAMSGE
jgi:nucleotide-binding universal stress UspA family protein